MVGSAEDDTMMPHLQAFKPPVTILLLAALVVMPAATSGVALSQTPTVVTGDFDGCPVTGSGGDPTLNGQKNRSAAPEQTTPTTIAQMTQLTPVPDSDVKTRSDWPAYVQNSINNQERQGAVLTGYVVKAIAEGPESCNCESPAANDHDVHIYVGDDPDATAGGSVIVEVTPRWRAVNPSWNAQNLKALADSGIEVRFTGWMMYDQEHWDMIDKNQRATLFEIHPVTGIQVQTPGGWVNLANYQFPTQ
jgi:hypothetical protein